MARLIDADKLRHELIMGHDLIGAKYTDMADTVKAIPIEWIEKQIEKALSVDSVDMFYVGHLKYLIKVWEKENEQNKENTSQTD